ncbi:hypothetical protein BJV77DRAFT_560650 [Russula vinacea]|nr:hypothetical protein BJV77DRAFT_560650 [Russula vinacea]
MQHLRGDWWCQIFKNHGAIFPIVDEEPTWSDVDDSLESMSEPMKKRTTRRILFDNHGTTGSLRAASKSGQSEGDTDQENSHVPCPRPQMMAKILYPLRLLIQPHHRRALVYSKGGCAAEDAVYSASHPSASSPRARKFSRWVGAQSSCLLAFSLS